MFEQVTDGLPVVGAEEWYLGGANVVIGLADEQGNLVGWFGRDYHPNRRARIDQIGAEEPPIGRPRLAIGLAIGEDEQVIGWFGSSFLKTVSKAVTAPVKAAVKLTTAPVRAAVNIAKGKPVAKSLTSAFVKPMVSTVKSQLAVAKPVVKVAAPIIKSPVTKAIAGGLAIAFPPIGVPAAAALAAATVALPYAQRGIAAAQKGLQVTAKLPGMKTAPKPAPKPVPKPAPYVRTAPVSVKPAPKPAAIVKAPAPMTPAQQAAYSAAMARAGQAAAKASAATTSKAAADARAKAAKAAADARAKAALALATADKVLSAAKGTMPAQKQAPPAVQAALKTAAKKTVAATYAGGNKLGDPDTKRGMAVLQVANRLQKIVPAARAGIPAVVAPVANQTYSAIHVDKKGGKQLGAWRAGAAVAGSGNATGTIVLRDGTPMQGNFARVG